MAKFKKFLRITLYFSAILVFSKVTFAQRKGGLPRVSLINKVLISNGPKGPIHGGESAVTDMVSYKPNFILSQAAIFSNWGSEY